MLKLKKKRVKIIRLAKALNFQNEFISLKKLKLKRIITHEDINHKI